MRFQKLWEKKDKLFFFFFFWWVASGSKTLWALIFSSGYKLEEETGAFQKRSSHHFRFLELWKSRHLKKNLKTQQKPSSPPVGFKQRLQNLLQAFCGWQSFPLTHLRPKKNCWKFVFWQLKKTGFRSSSSSSSSSSCSFSCLQVAKDDGWMGKLVVDLQQQQQQQQNGLQIYLQVLLLFFLLC